MTPLIIPPADTATVHTARWVMTDPWHIHPNGYAAVENGVIREVGSKAQASRLPNGQVIDHGPGVLMPPLVNAHTHLELSGLKGKLSFDRGFQGWVAELLTVREAMGTDALIKGGKSGMAELSRTGCAVVGDISSLGLTRQMLARSEMAGIWFKEILGNPTEDALDSEMDVVINAVGRESMTPSLAGHAPHTTAPEVLSFLKHETKKAGRMFAIHLDESEDETEFLTTGRGAWADFLSSRGIDISGWRLPVSGPIQYAEQLGLLDEHTLAVHLIHADDAGFDILKRRQVKICLCPRSNQNLHGRLPDLAGMLRAELSPCLGTDSLASVDTLNMFDEMKFTAEAFPSVRPEQIAAMTTVNGAEALNMADRFGSLSPGKQGTILYVPITASTPKHLLERLIHDPSSE